MKYYSFEEKYFGKKKFLGIAGREAAKIGYGLFAGMFRFPTTVRKIANKQTRIQREKYGKDLGKIVGASIGSVAGFSADILFLQETIKEASQNNYIPAVALGLTNFASLFYEVGRKNKLI